MSIPAVLKDADNLAYLALLLTWKEGRPTPTPPPGLTLPLDEFLGLLNDRRNRRYVTRRLSYFIRRPHG